jgi:hypothetical protein
MIETTSKDSILSLCHLLGNNNLEIICLTCFLTTDSRSEAVCVDRTSSNLSPQSKIAQNFELCSIETLLRLDSEILDDILADESLVLSSEDQLLKVLLKLAESDSSYARLFHNIHFELLMSSVLSDFMDWFNFYDLTPMIWADLSMLFIKAIKLELPRRKYFCSGLNSMIITGLPPLFPDLNDKQFNLLYRASRDGCPSYVFHQLCDGHANTLTIVLHPEGFVFGGYTPVPWDSVSGNKADPSGKSFIFTLKCPQYGKPRMFPLKRNAQFAIFCSRETSTTFCYDNYEEESADHSSLPEGDRFLTSDISGNWRDLEVFEITE